MNLCPPCTEFARRHRRALRWIVGIVLLVAFFSWVGAHAPVTVQPLMCKIYG